MGDREATTPEGTPKICAVVIGRNEGERLIACLHSMLGQVDRIIYVDSGSTDGSSDAARQLGVEVVVLDMGQPFTAARARNAGLKAIETGSGPTPTFVQLVDGDCRISPGWISQARAFLQQHPEIAVVCGRRREIAPEASVYNYLCDIEWETPVGETKACGGDALARLEALRDVGGYREDLIAGEEPELCVRLRQSGWTIWRLDAEMTLHDAQMTRFSQWWKRSRRAGHAFAEGAALHGAPPERHWISETRRAVLWGGLLPLIVIAAGVLGIATGWWLLACLWLLYPLQLLRLAARMGLVRACFSLLGKFAEAQGVFEFYWNRFRGKRRKILEYK